ncbi:MAG: hypothetical protein U0324_37535 [Polyangiales bacterium]
MIRVVVLVAACSLACAGTTAGAVRVPAVEVPDDAVRSGWAEARIAEGAPVVLERLIREGAGGMRALRLRHAEVESVFTEAGRRRVAGSVAGITPSPREPRWQMLAAHRGQALVGWCARGVRVAEGGGAEGFASRTLYVERLLLVGAEPGGRWALWVEGLVLTGAGWRMLPWVPYEDAVEAPRRDHSDLALWDCDLARRGW